MKQEIKFIIIDLFCGAGGTTTGFEESPYLKVIATQERLGLVTIDFISTYYSGKADSKVKSLDVPAGTITTVDHHAKISCIMNYHGTTKTLISSDKPCPVIVARQDKAPLSLITCTRGEFSVPIYENDSEVMIEIKKLMAKYGIRDIKTRMFTVQEKLEIQGFPKNYVLFGRVEDKGKFVGNSVTPIIPKMWINEMAKYV
jgi:DNA (cytosine-5)-methyltransferase 1